MIESTAKPWPRLIAAVAWLAVISPALAGDARGTIVRDSRILQDITRLRLDDLKTLRDDDAILLAHIKVTGPAQHQLDEATLFYEISIDVDEVLSGKFERKHWTFSRRDEPYFSGPDGLGLRREPYETAGDAVAILRISHAPTRLDIADTYVLPPVWAKDVADAYRYRADHPDLFSKTLTVEKAAVLVGLLHGKNSLLALASAKALAADQANAEQVMKEITASTEIRQAGLVLVFLQTVKPAKGGLEDVAEALKELIQKAQKPADLHGLALAAYRAGEWGEETMDDILTGVVASSSLDRLSAAERLQPILLRSVRNVFVELDPDSSDAYVAFCVGLGIGKDDRAMATTRPSETRAALRSKNAGGWRAEARTAYDLTRMPAKNLSWKSNPWALATLTPDPGWQGVQDLSWRLDENGWDIPVPANVDKRERLGYGITTGRVDVLAELGKKPDFATAFVEMTRTTWGGNKPGTPYAESLYDVFRPPGGIVVCMVNDGYMGRSRYYPALVIPPAWERDVVPAIDYWHEHRDIVSADALTAAQKKEMLRPLVQNANPLIACIAFRDLARDDLLETSDAVDLFMKADALRQAVFALSLLRTSLEACPSKPWGWDFDDMPAKSAERSRALERAVSTAKDFSKVRGIALAAYARYHVPPRKDNEWNAGTPLVELLLAKASNSPGLAAHDADLVANLKKWHDGISIRRELMKRRN